jgi:uncharacterized membrane protein YfcA
MDGLELALFLISAFCGGLVNGLAGFALGLVVSAVWLHLLTPVETAVLIIGYGVVLQAYGNWKLRHALRWERMWPFILGGAFGVPAGTILLTHTDPDYLRIGVGVLQVAYATYGLARPKIKPVPSNVPVDVGVGVINGLLSGLTGLPGVIVTIWCQLRGWPKDTQRSVFQPIIFATVLMSAVSMTLTGAVTMPTVKLYLLALPAVLVGTWSGHRLYGKLNDEAFRKVVLILLLVSGLTLIVPLSIFR